MFASSGEAQLMFFVRILVLLQHVLNEREVLSFTVDKTLYIPGRIEWVFS